MEIIPPTNIKVHNEYKKVFLDPLFSANFFHSGAETSPKRTNMRFTIVV
jgi:hypothetical protein